MPQLITRDTLAHALTFDAYIRLTESIVSNPSPGGKYQNEKTHRYTRSNLERMNKVLDTMLLNQKLYNQLSELKEKWTWLVLSEPWCGDASWGTPALYIISTATENIDFKILLRDENPEIMKGYQTAGGDSIPKLVCLRTEDLHELGTWGPRPQLLQNIVNATKGKPDIDYKEIVRQLHAWYEDDNTNSIQDEITVLVKQWMSQPI
jgi:hypothetical protein